MIRPFVFKQMKVIRFDQEAIWKDKYDWKQEMKNLLTFSGKQLTNQQKVTKNRYKMYAKQHGKKSKRTIPEMVKTSHKTAYINMESTGKKGKLSTCPEEDKSQFMKY